MIYLENPIKNKPIILSALKSKIKSFLYFSIDIVLFLKGMEIIGKRSFSNKGGINQINVSRISGVFTLKKKGEINTISIENPILKV